MTITEVLDKNKPIIDNINSTKHPKTKRFPEQLKLDVVSAIANSRDELVALKKLKIGQTTLCRWKDTYPLKSKKSVFKEVTIKDPVPILPSLTLESPSGFKIQGDKKTLISFIKEIENI